MSLDNTFLKTFEPLFALKFIKTAFGCKDPHYTSLADQSTATILENVFL